MRAVVRTRFGGPEVLEVREVDEPAVGDTDVLVRARASSVNPAESYAMSGTPYVTRPEMGLRRPKNERLGSDFATT